MLPRNKHIKEAARNLHAAFSRRLTPTPLPTHITSHLQVLIDTASHTETELRAAILSMESGSSIEPLRARLNNIKREVTRQISRLAPITSLVPIPSLEHFEYELTGILNANPLNVVTPIEATWYTEPITLTNEDNYDADDDDVLSVPFGRFRIILQFTSRSLINSIGNRPPNVFLYRPVTPMPRGEYNHPHLGTGTNICTGDNQARISSAFNSARLVDTFDLLNGIIRTYGEDPYISLREWADYDQVACSVCHRSVNIDDMSECEVCSAQVCHRCAYSCSDCQKILCLQHRSQCHTCHESHCSNCITYCTAEGCTHAICGECACLGDESRNPICADCHTAHEVRTNPTAALSAASASHSVRHFSDGWDGNLAPQETPRARS